MWKRNIPNWEVMSGFRLKSAESEIQCMTTFAIAIKTINKYRVFSKSYLVCWSRQESSTGQYFSLKNIRIWGKRSFCVIRGATGNFERGRRSLWFIFVLGSRSDSLSPSVICVAPLSRDMSLTKVWKLYGSIPCIYKIIYI